MSSRTAQLPFNKNTRESRLHYRDLEPTSFVAVAGSGSAQHEDRANGHDAERDARIGQSDAFMKQPVALVSRQVLRALGFNEIRRQCRLKFPRYTRREINQLARELHERAWKSRDREAVAKVMRGR